MAVVVLDEAVVAILRSDRSGTCPRLARPYPIEYTSDKNDRGSPDRDLRQVVRRAAGPDSQDAH